MFSRVVFGVEVVGRLPAEFQPYFLRAEHLFRAEAGSVDVQFREITVLPARDEFWVESHKAANSSSRFSLFRTPDGFGLCIECQGSGVFRITRQRIDIEWLRGGTSAAHYFFSYALPIWLEYMGVIVLHASAVSLNGVSIAFLGKSGAGKSSLAGGLSQMGGALVADDGLPIFERGKSVWQCLPGPPLLKLWPGSIEWLRKGNTDPLRKVHASFEKRVIPHENEKPVNEYALSLGSIYLLERRAGPQGSVQIRSGGDALAPVRLIEHSLAGGPASALGLSGQRFEQLARLVREIPVKILSYPSSAQHFPDILQALGKDVSAA